MTWVTQESIFCCCFSYFPNPSVDSDNIMKSLALPVGKQIL